MMKELVMLVSMFGFSLGGVRAEEKDDFPSLKDVPFLWMEG